MDTFNNMNRCESTTPWWKCKLERPNKLLKTSSPPLSISGTRLIFGQDRCPTLHSNPFVRAQPAFQRKDSSLFLCINERTSSETKGESYVNFVQSNALESLDAGVELIGHTGSIHYPIFRGERTVLHSLLQAFWECDHGCELLENLRAAG